MKMLLGDFSVEVGRKTFSNQQLEMKVYTKLVRVRIVNFATSKNLSEIPCSHIVTFINLHCHLLMERLGIKLTIF
jgi:hypothetical protein